MLTPVKVPAPPPPPVPNGVFLPSITMATLLLAGKPKTSLTITSQAAEVKNPGTPAESWQALGSQLRQTIPDLAALPADLAAAAPQAAALEAAAQDFANAVNQARRVITSTE